ncbi:MAG: CorA family divalent cation transporter, partial [Oscillospiraceae bacterium]
MFYLIKNGKVSDVDTNTFSDDNMPKNQQFLGVMCYDEIFSTADSIGLDYNQGVFDNRTPRFENHDGFDFVCINLINKQDLFEKSNAVYIHLKKDMLLFICEEPKIMEDILEKIIADNPNDLNISKLLCAVFDKITDDDTAVLQDIELELTLLEDALIESEKRTCVAEIISIRKRLMCLKVYYQQLLDIFDGICANENELIDNHIMRQFKIVANRLSRLFT